LKGRVMKRYLCFTCERDFSKIKIYKGLTYKNGKKFEYTKELCPYCHTEDFVDSRFIFGEIKKMGIVDV
jgi:DNA-directed RNA polymerase subunit RPC12/RpoP